MNGENKGKGNKENADDQIRNNQQEIGEERDRKKYRIMKEYNTRNKGNKKKWKTTINEQKDERTIKIKKTDKEEYSKTNKANKMRRKQDKNRNRKRGDARGKRQELVEVQKDR